MNLDKRMYRKVKDTHSDKYLLTIVFYFSNFSNWRLNFVTRTNILQFMSVVNDLYLFIKYKDFPNIPFSTKK